MKQTIWGSIKSYPYASRIVLKESSFKEEKGMTKNIVISSLPICVQRIGRIYDKKAVITCGFRETEPAECVNCGGFKNSLKK